MVLAKKQRLLFLEHGANVVLADMNKATLEETFELIKQKNFETECMYMLD